MPSATLLGQSVLSGVFIGALYGLLGLGLSLSWGMLRQVNLAHFALAFLGGYITFQLSGRLDPFVTLIVTVPVFFVAGMALHWFLSRYAPDMLNTLLVTFGLTSIIEAGIQRIWTADFMRMESHYGDIRWKLGAFYVAFPDLVHGVVTCTGIRTSGTSTRRSTGGNSIGSIASRVRACGSIFTIGPC